MEARPYRALLLINPGSRQGESADIAGGIKRLNSAGIVVEIVESKDVDEAKAHIAARHENIDFVITAGGDGTISSTAQILYRYRLPFAILPLGTANDLARSLGIPMKLDEAFDLIIAGKRRRIDLGAVNGHYFFNACHIGLGVRVTRELTPELKKKWGILGYAKALSSALASSSLFRVEFNVDGHHYRKRTLQLTIGNGRFYGGGNVIDENATIDDGLLNLSCIYPQSLWKLLLVSPLIRLGKQRKAENVLTLAGRHISVTTQRPMDIDADGELATQTPAEFEIIADALEVFVPAEDIDIESGQEHVAIRVGGK